MIEAAKGLRGQEMALCKCDHCAAEVSVAAAHGDTNGGIRGWKMHLRNEGQVITKLQSMGWSLAKRRLLCPKCTQDKKQHHNDPQEMKLTVTDIRKPTADQELDIIGMLLASYDRKSKRYVGDETDKTVAEAIGGGCMPGWVAAIREEKFGPAGNEEIEAIQRAIADLKRDTDTSIAASVAALVKARDEKVLALNKRIDAVCAAIGPKAARA